MQAMQNCLLEQELFTQTELVYFPEGLPAFEHLTEFFLIVDEENAPFILLQSIQDNTITFLMVDPFLICRNYLPDISSIDVAALDIAQPEDVLVISIVNMRDISNEGAYANLVSPVIINWKNKLGKQVILQNHRSYEVKHRIDHFE